MHILDGLCQMKMAKFKYYFKKGEMFLFFDSIKVIKSMLNK